MAGGKGKSSYTRLERLLILLALVVVAVMAYSYIADIPLRKLFSPWDHSDQTGRVVGTVVKVEGRVLRQRSTDFDFKPLEESQQLYANDTIMTGPDSTVIIALLNGKRLEIKPNSLVKLTFAADLNGNVRIDVLQGGTTDDFAKVVPLKGQFQTPYEDDALPVLSEITPAPDVTLDFSQTEFAARKKTIAFSFKLDRQSRGLAVHIVFIEAGSNARTQVASGPALIDNNLHATIAFAFARPGTYEWQVLNRHGKPILTQTLRINPKVDVIHTLPPLNTSSQVTGQSAKRSYEGIVLHWEPLEGAGTYAVKIFKKGGVRPVLERDTKDQEITINPHEVRFERGSYTYLIQKMLPDGFIAQSGVQRLSFEILPPFLSAPEPNYVYDQTRLYGANNTVFLTWNKTNFTARYQLEVATEPYFKRPVLEKLTKDNYVPFVAPPNGEYYWRVRSDIEGHWTDYSKSRHFKVAVEN